MACHTHTALPLLLLLPFLFAAAADDVVAPAPGPSPPGELNLTSILESGGQYSTLLRLLQATRISEQLTSQLKNSYDGLTDQQKIQLLLYTRCPPRRRAPAACTAST